jgi:hypothetical protein
MEIKLAPVTINGQCNRAMLQTSDIIWQLWQAKREMNVRNAYDSLLEYGAA